MKKILFSARCLLAASIIFFTSCSKNSTTSNPGGGTGNTTNLAIGKSAIGFTTSATFGGLMNFSLNNTTGTTAVSVVNGTTRTINVAAREEINNKFRKAEIDIDVPSGTSTSGGNITIPLMLNSTAPMNAKLSMYNGTDINTENSYFAESGTVTITKLSASEIIGTFSAVVKNVIDNSTITITNGRFSGRFN